MDRLYRHPPPFPSPPSFCKSPLPHRRYFYPLIQQEKQPGRRKPGWSGGGGWGYYLGADRDHGHWRFTALPFMWSGSLVGSNYRPNDPNRALWWSSRTEWLAAPFVFACVCGIVSYAAKQSRAVCVFSVYVCMPTLCGLGEDSHTTLL